MLANDGATLVPMAVPPICRKWRFAKSKLFILRTLSSKIRLSVDGFSKFDLNVSKVSLAAWIPMSLGM